MSALGASQQELTRTETALVEAARRGDERAFGELYERYGRRVFAYVLGMVSDHSRAEDIVQDVFVSALRWMRSSEGTISFKPWIYEIAKNACIDEFRRVQRSREVSIEQGSGEHLVSRAPSPDACFERGQQLATLHGAFRGLSARQHTVLVLRELEGLPYTEIAARTGMTVPMVESALLRARRRLNEEYDDIASGRRCQQIHAIVDSGGQVAVDTLGVRERRRFARHVAHCQPCARYVHMAGVTTPETGLPAVAKKIAGLLPFPIARWSLPWGRRAAGGSHGPRLLRPARRAAQFAHPGASVGGATPATVATVAAVVIAGGGAAIGLLAPGHAAPTQPGPATISARPAAATRAVRAAPPRRANPQRGQAGSVTGTSGRSASATRSGAARTVQSHHGAVSTTPAAHTTTPTIAPVTSAPPSAPSTSSSPSSPSVHLPVPVPALPGVPTVKHLVHTVTSPLGKVVKKLPVVKTLPVPPLPGGLGKTVGDLPGKVLGDVGGL